MTESATIDADARTLRMTRDLSGSIKRVYEAFTSPKHLQRWWGPEGIETPHVDMDVREGGPWTTTMRGADGAEFVVSGEYVELKPHHRLAFTWGWTVHGERGHSTLVEIDLERVGEGTRLTLVQSVFETREDCERHEQGWTSSFNCLAAVTKN
jgi:uncharacterized protein YndB with AHSA1/START domain